MEQIYTPFPFTKALPDTVFIDIETTGLSKVYNNIYCIGMLYDRGKQWETLQYLCHDVNEEKEMLQLFLEKIKAFSTLITYGGTTFDLLFIKERAAFYSLDTSIFLTKNILDYKKLPFIAAIIKEGIFTRLTLEESLGYTRNLTIKGKELIKMYQLWQTSKLPIHQQVFLTHNQEELMSLFLMEDIYSALQALQSFHLYSYVNNQPILTLTFSSLKPFSSSFSFTYEEWQLNWRKHENYVTLSISYGVRTLKSFLSPAKDYYFIPSENQIIHRSIATFIPKELKKKVATKDCFLEKTHTFLRVYSKTLDTLCYDESNNPYLPIAKEDTLENPLLEKGLKSIITYILRGLKKA